MNKLGSKILAPVITAVVVGALTWFLRDGCGDTPSPLPALPAQTVSTPQRDSIDIDSMRARIVAELKPSVRVIRVPVPDSLHGTDSLGASIASLQDSADRRRIADSIALAEAYDVIRILNDKIDASMYIQDIVATHDTTIVDSTRESTYWLRQSFSFREQTFGLELKHEYLAREPTIWSYIKSLGPYVAGAVAIIKLIIDSTSP